LFDAGTAERLSLQFARMLEAVASDPDRPVVDVDLIGDEGRSEIAAWNDAAAHPEHRAEPPVHVGVATRARRTPDAVAVAWEGGALTFAEVEARANRLARHLVSLGVRPDSRVAVCLERGPEMVIALLAVLKAGAAYVPVDPDYPAERKAWLLRDSSSPIVLTQSHLAADLSSSDAMVIALDEAWGEIETHPATDPGIFVDPESLAYVIYTSGSTGLPKGAEVPHRALANHMAWMRRVFPLGEGGSVLQKTPFGFDASVWEFWAPLLEGGRLVMARPGGHRDPAYLIDAIAREGITTLQLVPALLRALVEEPGVERCASLRRVFVGGEALAADLVEALKARLDVEVINLYGPTEACIDASYFVAAPPSGAPGVPIGRPVDNDRLYVLDDALRPVPPGVVGELCIGGEGLARGYLRRPGMTASAFVPDALSGVPGARLYRTGDRVRLGADGELRYVGRADFQVKVRGHRVEPGEVESALLRHPTVREAVVVAADDRLAAYVVPAEGAAVSTTGLRDHLRAVLPEPLVPTAWMVLESLPLTPNGKVDRAALPAPEAAVDTTAHAAPRTPTEEVLAGVWATLLGIDRVGVNDDFFALGGHSLLATQVMSRLRQAFRVDLPLRELFDAPTVARLAERVDSARAAAEGMDDVPLVRIEGDGDLPLSFAQERLWFVERLQPGRAIYNMPMAIRLSGDLDPEALRASLEGIVHRHEPLRTTFAVRDGRPVQVIAPPSRFDLPLADLGHLPLAEAEREAARLAGEDGRAPFDLEHGPLFRAALVRRAEGEWTLLLNTHHAVGDAWSTEVLLRELAALYSAALAGTEAALPPLPVRYADHAAWQRAWLSGERLERQLAYWRRTLSGAPVLELPADRPRPRVQSFRGGYHGFRLPAHVAEGVDRLARAEGATRFMTLLAAFKALLLRYTGQDDVVVGSPIAGRTRAETEGLVGLFVNTLALRTDLGGDPGYRELLRRVRESTLDAYAYQDLPFEKLVEELRVERSLGRHPVFQVSFSVQGMEADPAGLPGVRMDFDEGDTGTTKFDLTFAIWPSDGGLAGGIEYAADLFDAATVERMARHFEALLEAALAEPDRPLSRLPGLLQGDERRRVLAEWSRTEHTFPALPVHALFEAQVDRAPDDAAISFDGREISYAELDGRANRLAHHLIARGVGPETRVGLFASRSPEAVVAILAILKAGGAWLPLDPSNPAARLAWMASDAGVSNLVAIEEVPAELAAAVGGVIDLRNEADGIAARPAERPRISVDLDHLAYVIYTSGSTGTPKGVLVTHRGVPNLALAQVRRFAVERGSRVLQFASLSFDASVSELFATFLGGATLVVAPREALVPGPALIETMRRERVTHVTLPPSVLAVLSPDGLPELRTLVSAGEAVSAGVVERWAPGRRFVNAYGPTEVTVGAAAGACEPDGRPPAIGRPFENVRVYVLDAGGDPVPMGVPGELFVGGPGVARGYHGRAGLTAERFVPDPLSGEPGARLYRTGDRVRWRAEGELEFIGRTDEQVKLRGFRIEPGEVAAVLCALPGVRDALALVREHAGDRRLVAWIVAEPGADQPTSTELRAELKRRLPEYMVPSAVVVMDDFPRTPNGKIDRAALPLPEAEAGEAFVAPRGETEGRIAGVWSEVLGRGAVGVNDNFFEIGGHSLLLVQLHERLRAALGIDVTLVDLFQFPTVAALAERVERQAKAAQGDPPPQPAGAGRDRGSARRQALIRKR
ncbi:MAG TPA: amino acid adenylation domain-containing protein, partial [Longimicrobium sp.]|nr:amino acid adenylation domain-containing protein [Longimicrobium sp.]